MNGDRLAAIVGILAALVLAWRGVRWRRLPPGRGWMMALTWMAIIVAAVLIVEFFGVRAQ